MNQEQPHPEGVDHQETEPLPVAQPSAIPAVPGQTMPDNVTGYPPPSGSPFVHQPPFPYEPAPAATTEAQPPLPWFPAAQASSVPPLANGSSASGGAKGGLGAGIITAIVAGALAVALVAAVLGGVLGGLLVNSRDGGSATLPVPPAGSTARPEGSIADIAAKSLPSVVTIKVQGADAAGTGSGFVLRQDGYILTNNHVVAAAGASGKITVIFLDGKSAVASVVGQDASYDLAVIRVGRKGLPVLTLGSSSSVVVGDPVIAVGAPLGLDSTVTSGIVSALNRPVTPGGAADSTTSFINAIQTDAAINPGNSGGPLLDMAGRVIGVNSAIARIPGAETQVGSIGVGFAIPSDQVRKTADQLMATGKATHPVIGVLIDTTYKGVGVKIAPTARNGTPPITKGGPADKAGLRPGDVIITFDGRPVTGPDEFVVAIRARSVGDQVVVTVRRGTTERTVKMTLQAAS